MGGRDPRRRLDLFLGRARPAVRDVLGHGPGEEDRLLRHQPDLLAERGDLHPPEIGSVDQDLPVRRVVEPGNQVDETALARAAGADDGDVLPRAHVQGDVAERPPARVVGMGHVPEPDVAGEPPRPHRVGRLHHGFRDIQHLEDAHDPRHRLPGFRIIAKERSRRIHRQRQIGQERHQRAGGHLSRRHVLHAGPHDEDQPQRIEHAHQRHFQRDQPADPVVLLEGPFILPAEARLLPGLLRERADDPGAGDRLLEQARQRRHPRLGPGGALLDLAAKDAGRDDERPDRAEGEERQAPVHEEQRDDDADDQQPRRQQVDQPVEQAGLDELGVLDRAGDHLAAVPPEKAVEGPPLDLPERVRPQVGHEPVADERQQRQLDEQAEASEDIDGENDEGGGIQDGEVAARLDDLVDHEAHVPGDVQPGDGDEDSGDEASGKLERVRPEITGEPSDFNHCRILYIISISSPGRGRLSHREAP